MKTILVVISCCLTVLIACVGAALFQARQQAEVTKRTTADLNEQVKTLSTQVDFLATEKARLEENLQTQTAATQSLQQELEQQRLEAQPAPEPVQPPKPFRVQTYLGREPLGEAWLVPRNFAQDPKTGRASYEPHIVLDEKLKEKFTVRVYETNYVPQPIPSTVNYNYTPPREYYYPVYYSVPFRHRPDRPPRDPQPTRPVFPTVPAVGGGSSGSPWGSVFVPPR